MASRWAQVEWLVAPAIVFLVLCLFAPVSLLLATSFLGPPVGLASYQEFVSSPALVNVLVRTVLIALLTTAISLVAGYPFAYLASSSKPAIGRTLIAIVSLSLFLSLVVRAYAWLAILDRGGILDSLIKLLRPDYELVGVHNLAGVLIGTLQYSIVFMVLPIYDVMTRVDRRVLLAADSLGAPPVRKFLEVYLPMTMPGVAAGCSIVFISTMGYYVIPSLLGGPQNTMIGQIIAFTITTTLQWGLGSALASTLLVLVLAIFVAFYRTAIKRIEAARG